MLGVALDVHYEEKQATVAAVTFDAWNAPSAKAEYVSTMPYAPAEYEPGQFYKRELPYLTGLLSVIPDTPTVVVVDGYVWLGPQRRGLGMYLHDSLGDTPVVGVAKRSFAGNNAIQITRGKSQTPLWITAQGMAPQAAASYIGHMAGPYRIPTLLKRVDQLCRGLITPLP
jgi:deoxyribonuclease V